MVCLNSSQYVLVREAMLGSMLSFWRDSVSQETTSALSGVVIFPSVFGLYFRMRKSNNTMLGGILLMGYVSVIRIVRVIDISG